MEGRELKAQAAITGLGISEMGRVYGHDAQHFAAEAIQRAVADAGLRKDQIDGLLVNPGVSPLGGMGGVGLQNYLGLTNLRLLSSMNAGGATANIMVQYAAMHVVHGLANHVVCVFADAPLQPSRGGGAAYASMGRTTRPSGMGGLYSAFGVMGGPIQPPGHVQTITRLVDHRMNAQAVLDAGTTVLLYTDNNRMRFAVNIDAAQRQRLRLSSRLLSLARIVKGRNAPAP